VGTLSHSDEEAMIGTACNLGSDFAILSRTRF
jgi:hypothetical protein